MAQLTRPMHSGREVLVVLRISLPSRRDGAGRRRRPEVSPRLHPGLPAALPKASRCSRRAVPAMRRWSLRCGRPTGIPPSPATASSSCWSGLSRFEKRTWAIESAGGLGYLRWSAGAGCGQLRIPDAVIPDRDEQLLVPARKCGAWSTLTSPATPPRATHGQAVIILMFPSLTRSREG